MGLAKTLHVAYLQGFRTIWGVLTDNGLLRKYIAFGAEGVRAFFILSGFLMCCSRDLAEERIARYYKKRTIRILPLYYSVILVYCILGIAQGCSWPSDERGLYWLRYIFLLSTSVPAESEYWTNLGATWTISYFALFYLLAPLFHRFISSWIRCIGIIIPVLFAGAVIIPDGYAEPVKGLYAFLAGMLICLALIEGRTQETVVFFSLMTAVFNVAGLAYPYGDTFLLGIIIIAMLGTSVEYRLRALDPLIHFLDRHSYAIYLLHPLAGSLLSLIWQGSGAAWVLGVLALTLILSIATDYIQELINSRFIG